VNADGNTPLHWACLNGHADAVQILLAAGASACALNAAQRTPVDEAQQAGAADALQKIYEITGGGADEVDDVEEDTEEGTEEELMLD